MSKIRSFKSKGTQIFADHRRQNKDESQKIKNLGIEGFRDLGINQRPIPQFPNFSILFIRFFCVHLRPNKN